MNESTPVVVEQDFETSVECLWSAITVAEQMKKWFFQDIESFEPQVGFSTRFNVQIDENKNFVHLWKLTEVVPREKIVYHWCYEGYSGESFVTFALSGDEQRSSLKVTHVGLDNFPKDVPELSRESGLQGWNYFIKSSLKDYLSSDN
ncbi:SRPBCC family protein [Candidatus Uabimicrobium amorphum]|uniref:ATPase n=1 Tax=Uabimicrobium amorphum TaxID=2596890 RepID=A0A5S9IM38_UABAM|nr:SRPBCC domain-containing protein [Candidatus Uabimicrobium amorphum]BBM84389.1 ATPase [Candidatus Uabimicrobium amorphum]